MREVFSKSHAVAECEPCLTKGAISRKINLAYVEFIAMHELPIELVQPFHR